MNAEEQSLPAQLFSENEWRLLWWKTVLLQIADPEFPTEPHDIEWIAYAAEMSIRHLCRPIIKYIQPLVDAALAAEQVSGVSVRVRQLLVDFQHEMTNPVLAQEFQDGPWQAQYISEDPSSDGTVDLPGSVDSLLYKASHAVTTRLWLDWQRYGDVDWKEGGIERRGRNASQRPTLIDHIGFANFDLHHAGLPIIEVDHTGRLSIDLTAVSAARDRGLPAHELRRRVDQLVARHGFSLTD